MSKKYKNHKLLNELTTNKQIIKKSVLVKGSAVDIMQTIANETGKSFEKVVETALIYLDNELKKSS